MLLQITNTWIDSTNQSASMLQEFCLQLACSVGLFSGQVFGLWPFFFDRRRMIFSSAWYLRGYSIVMVLTTLYFCLTNYTTTIGERKSRTYNLTNQIFTGIMTTVLVMYFVAQHLNHRKIHQLLPVAIRLMGKLALINEDLPYMHMLMVFFFKTMLLDSAIIFSSISYASTRENSILRVIAYWVVPNLMISVVPDLLFATMQIVRYYFIVINRRMEAIMASVRELTISPIDSGTLIPVKNHLRMKRFCELSDRIDDIAVLHLELCSLTKSITRLYSTQLLAWTVYGVTMFIVKLFREYIVIAAAVNEESSLNPHLFLNNLISLTSTFLGLVFLANICSKTMKEVCKIKQHSSEINIENDMSHFQAHRTGNILHVVFLNSSVDIRFKRSVGSI